MVFAGPPKSLRCIRRLKVVLVNVCSTWFAHATQFCSDFLCAHLCCFLWQQRSVCHLSCSEPESFFCFFSNFF